MKQAIIDRFEALLNENDFKAVKAQFQDIKEELYEARKKERKEAFEAFKAQGGEPDEFEMPADPLNDKYKALLDVYGEQREVYRAERAARDERKKAEQKEKVKAQKEIVEKVKTLIAAVDGSQIGKAFDDIKALQNEWKEIGRVNNDESKAVQIDYNHQVDVFFHNINLMKEARAVDLGKNFEMKKELVDKIEGLMENDSIRKMESLIKKFQYEWRDLGPVPREYNEDLYTRFRTACDKVYDKINGHYDERRGEMQGNLKAKIALCEQVQAINAFGYDQHHEWQEKTDEILEIQEAWKKIGFSEENEKIWQVFRNSCNRFFNSKRAFYDKLDSGRDQNKERKEALCTKVEELTTNTDWRSTTNAILNLQKEWKTVGAASRKDENALWQRFRAACDAFFEAKRTFYAQIGEKETENLKLKEALVERLKATALTGDNISDLNMLKDFAKEWNEIGFVPIKNKMEITNAYNDALNEKYGELDLEDSSEKPLLIFKNKIEVLLQAGNGDVLINREREVIQTKIAALQDEITQYENNIGFFSNAKKANDLLKEVQDKLTASKAKLADMHKKLRIVNTTKITA